MEEILKMARELGAAVAKHPHYRALRDAEEAAAADADAKVLIESFNSAQERMLALARDRKPIEPEDKRKLADLQKRVMAHPVLKRLQAAQVNFKHLMDTMNRAIHEGLEPDSAP